jgi:hypothetical protein
VDGNEEEVGLLLLPEDQIERASLRWSWSGTSAVVKPDGARILCNGSRRDATVSGMLSQSTGAARVYLLDGVPRGQRPPTAGIFDPAEPAMVGTLSEQNEFRRSYFGE